jgi:mannose-1-phosphate guanylyltransferase
MKDNNFGVIMAGGVGSRFWPMSKSTHPKQFMDILGTGTSLLQQTFNRLSQICPKQNIYIVTNADYRDITLQQLPGILPDQVLCEPERRNTAPCIAYASLKIAGLNPGASVIVAPSDHLILNEAVFVEIISKALDRASKSETLITVGITPSRPDTGYGYIHFDKSSEGFSQVLSFKEKPNLEAARKFLESGDYSWNSGMFIWSAASVEKAFQQYLPDMLALFNSGRSKLNSAEEQSFIDAIYPQCENISIDYGIMEKADNVYVMTSTDIGLSDLGTWGSLYEHSASDKNGNAVVRGDTYSYDNMGNIFNIAPGKIAVIQGLKDYIVIDADDVLLIVKKEEEQNIKQYLGDVKKLTGEKYI